jgi:hypothetical protein
VTLLDGMQRTCPLEETHMRILDMPNPVHPEIAAANPAVQVTYRQGFSIQGVYTQQELEASVRPTQHV